MPNERAFAKDSFLSWKGEIYRKGIHLTSLSMPVGFFLLSKSVVVICLSIGLFLSLAFDGLRIFGNHSTKQFLTNYFGFLMRPREQKSLSGASTIILAGLLSYLAFDLHIAAAAMVIVVVGDTSAAIIGRKWGKTAIFDKSIEGSLAFVIFSLLAVWLVPDVSFLIRLVGAITGAIIELLPIPIDDNIRIPIASGAFMQILYV